MKNEVLESLVEQAVLDKIAGTDLELVDVEYVKERDWFLRIYLDKPGGLEIEDCQEINHFISKFLDEKDPIKGNYYLEVSSPGLDRQLKKPKDFIRHCDETVDVHFFKPYEGQKLLVGVLGQATAENIEIGVGEQIMLIPRTLISKIKLHLDF